jgi:deoxyribodipyrimidine photo-lyase
MREPAAKNCTLIWFRQDLRLADNSALAAAIERGVPIVPVFIFAPQEEGLWQPGGATRWWMHHALADLEAQLVARGLRLIIRDARNLSTLEVLHRLAKAANADAVFWNRRHEPAAVERDAKVRRDLEANGIATEIHESSVLFAPEMIANKSGKPFQVFTPMWKHIQTLDMPKPVRVKMAAAKAPTKWPDSDQLESLGLLPRAGWDVGFRNFWGAATRKRALTQLRKFIRADAQSYPELRDSPSDDGTTRLSPYLHCGQIGVRETWWKFAEASNRTAAFDTGIMRQIIWREFAHHLLHHFPHTPQQPLRPEFALFPWKNDSAMLRRWQLGETGYPIVDAGMRQLWQTGWMHNRVRMIVGSLLVKHLLQHWIEGARWFWDTLVDADLANNTLGWQWIGGCGADAAPYFRIFNPITQGERFDPDGKYVARYIPELKNLPAKFIHRPWDLGTLDLGTMGITLGKNYPLPIVEHAEGRARALDAFDKLKSLRQK